MARAPSPKVGRGSCLICGETVTYRRSTGGLLTCKCDGCDSSGFYQQGGVAHNRAMGTIKADPAPPEPPPNPKGPENTPAPTQKTPKPKGFSMDDL